MQVITVSALLTDATGAILVVRRKGSALWRLPGGVIPISASPPGMILSFCRRQVGVAPDFVLPPFGFEFSGRRAMVMRDVIRHEQARACGWIESVQWCRRDTLPVGLDPMSAMAISLGETVRLRELGEARDRGNAGASHTLFA